MKTFVFLCSLAILLSSCQGLHHLVRVFVKRSGSDIGNTVEMVTRVRFFGTTLSETQTESGIPEETLFPGNGERIFRHVFTEDPGSILVTVTENDGSGTSRDDGVCKILLNPQSFPVGSSRYECNRGSINGLSTEWVIFVLINSFFPIG